MMSLRAYGLDLAVLSACGFVAAFAEAAYTPLTPLPAARIKASSQAYPGDNFVASHLVDGNPRTEYSSDNHGTNTFVQFGYSAPVRLGAFRHIDRNDPATVAASELVLLDADGNVISTNRIQHSGARGAETFFILPQPVSVHGAKWRITELGPQHLGTVGGAEISFYEAGMPEENPSQDTIEVKPLPLLKKEAEGVVQPFRFTMHHPYVESADAILRCGNEAPHPLRLRAGTQTIELAQKPVSSATLIQASIEVSGRQVAKKKVRVAPVRPLTVYVLPHSHTDIGYTEIQTEIEKRQVQNLIDGIAAAKRTARYPEGSRFVWNVEVLWAADLYLRRLDAKSRTEFLDAVKSGQVVLNGMYLNELTGLCRPEELVRLFSYATRLANTTGVPIESVMISDVPGYTWGTVTAMAHADIRYFSTAPNYFDRIGTILREWENKPFWWMGPDGNSKVLVWIPFWGYAMSHRYGKFSRALVEDFCDGLEQRGYPYDIAHVRWSGHGDNAVPDPVICDFVRDWNQQYAWPRFVISGTTEAFRALETRYGHDLPVVRGDWTPYWEDGAGSSALETAMNRRSSDRLVQAETLYAMLDPKAYPTNAFENAWNQVLLYSEHTWGAYCSVTGPERQETKEQWAIKQGYAAEADRQSRVLLDQALMLRASPAGTPASVDVINTVSWTRTGLVVVPPEIAKEGDRVIDNLGRPVPSQRLATGNLVFLAQDVPPLAARQYRVTAGQPHRQGTVTAHHNRIENELIQLRIDEGTGGIVDLRIKGTDANFADTSEGGALNSYLYLIGDDVKNVQRNGPVRLSVGEKGPLVASILIASDAPGCKSLVREVRLTTGQDFVELFNLVDKARLASPSYMSKDGKESLNFAFPFNVPNGQIVLDLPLGMMRPELDQMPSACKNWLTVGRWADVSGNDRGITWCTLDAPLVQIGGLTATLLNSQTNPDIWLNKINRTQKVVSWAMNNHWGTNYRAYQEGPTMFCYVLRPHRQPDLPEASRFATGCSQPLLVAISGAPIPATPFLAVEPSDVLVTSIKPSDDGRAWIIRLFNASSRSRCATLKWSESQPQAVYLSNTSEIRANKIRGSVCIPKNVLATLRAEF